MKIKKNNTNNYIFIIAEIGNNHEGSITNARKLIALAKKSGADAVKFQTMRPEKLINSDDTNRMRLLKKFEFTKKQFVSLKKYCDSLKIIFLSTPFDLKSVDDLNPHVPLFKISSGDNNYFELIEKVLETKKPLVISTGLSNKKEIDLLFQFIKKKNKFRTDFRDKLAFLHCVSNYPTSLYDASIENINYLKKYKCTVGYSDHTIGIEACLTAVVLGARIIEKHFTIDKNFSDFRDHAMSADPQEFKKMVESIRKIEILLKNKNNYREVNNINLRRSARYLLDIKAGITLNDNKIKWVRPGNGILNINKSKIIGKRLKVNVKKNDQVEFKHLK